MKKIKVFLEDTIFASRWLLLPFYLGLTIALAIYCFRFCLTLWELIINFHGMEENLVMLSVLTLIDITMVANLIKMIIIGSYHNFVEPIDADHTEKVSSGLLKVKMGSSLIGVSSIHLLQAFINSQSQTKRELFIKCSIHLIFVVSTVALAFIDYLHEKGHDKSHTPSLADNTNIVHH